jgi:hypothetical protein
MKTVRSLVLGLFLVFTANSVFAGPFGDALARKLVSSTTDAEKAICVRWMFVAMSLHPDLQQMSTVTAEQREQANREFAQLVVRMLTETCLTEAREAMKYEGQAAVSGAFEVFGQTPARELFSNPEVSKGMEDLDKYTDSAAIEKALTGPK